MRPKDHGLSSTTRPPATYGIVLRPRSADAVLGWFDQGAQGPSSNDGTGSRFSSGPFQRCLPTRSYRKLRAPRDGSTISPSLSKQIELHDTRSFVRNRHPEKGNEGIGKILSIVLRDVTRSLVLSMRMSFVRVFMRMDRMREGAVLADLESYARIVGNLPKASGKVDRARVRSLRMNGVIP